MAPHPPIKPEIIRNMALALVETSTAPLLLLDADLCVIAASASFCAAFQIESAQTVGRRLAELGAGEWNVPQLSSLLKATATGYAEVEGYEMDLARDGRPARHLVLNAKKLSYAGEEAVQIILSVADKTAARLAEKLREDLLREKDILVQELHHRVANSLQIIASVLMQSARRIQTALAMIGFAPQTTCGAMWTPARMAVC